MKKTATFFFIIITFSFTILFAHAINIDQYKEYKLSDKWQFIPDDTKNYSEIELKSDQFDLQYPHFSWQENPKYKNYYGYAWFRHEIYIDKLRNLALLLPFHYCGAQVYLNGKKFYETRPFNNNNVAPYLPVKPETVDIPDDIVKKGINVLAIRTGVTDYKSGFIEPITIGPKKLIQNIFQLKIIWLIALVSINLFIMLYFLFTYYYRREIYYLHFSLLSFTLGIWTLGYHGLNLIIIDNYILYIIITYMGAIGVCIFFISFLHSFLKIKFSKLTISLLSLLLLLILLISIDLVATGHINHYNKYIFKFFILSALLVVIYGDILCIYGIIKKKPFAARLFAGTFILSLSYAISVIVFLDLAKIYVPLSEGFFVMTVIFASTLAVRFSQVHSELEKAHGDLLVLDKMKDDFLSTTTHELRTPLHGIMGLAESLVDGTLGNVNEEQKENLNLIRLSAGRLNNLVTSMLDFSKLRAGRADLFIDEVALGDVITSVVSLLQPTVRGKYLEFITDIGPLPKVQADRNRLFQVLINLVGNAIKFTDEGSITVSASPAGSDTVRVEVADTGAGIAPEDLDRIWTPFAQAGDTDTRRSGGTGLGLAITKHLVELHGGRIWAERRNEKGSVFIFEIPVKARMAGIERAQAKQYDLSLPEGGAPGPEENIAAARDTDTATVSPEEEALPEAARRAAPVILAVDDDPVNLKVIENLCRPKGYGLRTAADGPAALAMFEAGGIDLVLLDLMLPGMSGYEVCRTIRRMDNGRYVPIVMVTARDQASDLAHGFRTGASDYITKPFNREELVLRIENQLAIKQILDMEKSISNGLRREKNSITGLLERSMDLKESALQMVEWEKVIREDLGIARAFQDRLMTHQRGISGIETSVSFHPLMEVGGDVFDLFQYKPGVVRIFLADATGHGITASLNTVKILAEYAAIKESMGSPSEVINFLNQRFTRNIKQYGIVFTCVIADIDIESAFATVATAGMPPQFIRRGGEIAVIDPMNPIIGLSAGVSFREDRHAFNRGDILFLHSDGLIEMIEGGGGGRRSRSGETTGLLADAIASAYNAANLDSAGDELIRRFGGVSNITIDDVTIIAVKLAG